MAKRKSPSHAAADWAYAGLALSASRSASAQAGEGKWGMGSGKGVLDKKERRDARPTLRTHLVRPPALVSVPPRKVQGVCGLLERGGMRSSALGPPARNRTAPCGGVDLPRANRFVASRN